MAASDIEYYFVLFAHIVIYSSAWYAYPVTPRQNDWMINGDGKIECNYGPESVYKDNKYDDVLWTYQKPNTTKLLQVYYYLPNGRNASYEHLKDRATHIQTSTQMKLIIHETKASDDGIYRGTIEGSEGKATCEVKYTTRSKVYI